MSGSVLLKQVREAILAPPTIFPWSDDKASIGPGGIANLELQQMPVGFNLAHIPATPHFQSGVGQFACGTPKSIARPLEEEVYDVLADAKIKTRLIGNHIPRDWQVRLFGQLDRLHDIEEWELGDRPMRKESYHTFLSVILSVRPSVRPGLGLSHKGDLLGTWGEPHDRITLEFMPSARLRWTIASTSDGQLVRSAGDAPASDLEKYLAPFDPAHWWHRSAER